jgi:Na+-transporting NADH:ubiquinone oxidoreductase subunit NqrD
MTALLPLLAIVTGLLAASSVVIKKMPDASKLIEKIRPYEAFIGAAALIMSIFSLFKITLYFKLSFFLGVFSAACIGACIVMGFLLGFPMIQEMILDEMDEKSRKKGEELYEKLTPYKVLSGLVGIVTGAYLLLTVIF